MFTRKHLALISADLTSRIQITLVADEHDCHIRVSVLLHLLEPASQVRERITTSDIVDKESASRTTIVRTSDTLERLLASGIPDLKLNVLLRDLDGARAELNTDCQIMLLAEPLVRELE